MNNNKELDQLVESFFQPKKSTTLGLKELFALFEEVQRITEVETPTVIPSAQEKGYEQENISISTFYKTYNEVLAKNIPEGSDPIDKIKNFIIFVDNLVKSKGNPQDINLSSTYAAIIFTSSLYKLIQDFIPDQPQSAGFFFEKFINLLFTTGRVTIEGETDKLPIQDIEVEMNGKIYYLSLKFVKSNKITGSIGNMLRFFGNKSQETFRLGNYNFSSINFKDGKPIASAQQDKQIIYIIATKPSIKTGQQSITFNMYQFGFQQFLDMLGTDNATKYNSYISDPKSKMIAELSGLRKEKTRLEDILLQNKYQEVQKLKDNLALMIQKNIENEDRIKFVEGGASFEGRPYNEYEEENPYKDDELTKLNNTKSILEFNIENLTNEIKFDYAGVPEEMAELKKSLEAVNNLIISKTGDRSEISDSHLQFTIYPTSLEQNNNKSASNLSLSLTAQERNTILQNNSKVFTDVVNRIIEEANIISYKVNNYLLSIDNEKVSEQKREQIAKEAYDSATKLQNDLGTNTGIVPVDNKPK